MAQHLAPASIVAATLPRHCAARASGAATVLALAPAVEQLARLRPPPAYRLSVDSGVEYKNVRRALAQPWSARVDTWRRLLHSLRLRLVAAACAEDVMWPGEHTRIVALCAGAAALVPATAPADLHALRLQAGLSRRALARLAGVATDAVQALEDGGGMLASLDRVCAAHGLQILLALPPWHDNLDDLWREQSLRCLQEPAHYRQAHGTPGTGRPRFR